MTTTSPDQLIHLGDEVLIRLARGTFQWVSIKRFRLACGGRDDRSVLALLIAHDRYADDYAGGDGLNPRWHGPYRRDLITPECFDQVAAADQEPLLRAWAHEYAPVPGDTQAELDHELYAPLRSADSLYRLRDLGPAGYHEWGGVHNEFQELVLIDRHSGSVALIVAADD